MFEPKQLIINTGDLAFGVKPPQVILFELQMFEDETSSQTYTVTAPNPVPFEFAIEQNTLRPKLALMLTSTPDKIALGTEYILTINGPDNYLVIKFLYGEGYRPTDWRMSANESIAGNSFHFKEIDHGTKILTTDLNSKFKMLFEYVYGLVFKFNDLAEKFETKRRVKDIIDCAVNGGVFPKNCTTTVIRNSTGDQITELILNYSDSDQPYTSIKYLYTDAVFSYVFNDPNITNFSVTKPVLHRIEINRISTAILGASQKYQICAVQFYRELKTYESMFGATVTVPMISRWDIIE